MLKQTACNISHYHWLLESDLHDLPFLTTVEPAMKDNRIGYNDIVFDDRFNYTEMWLYQEYVQWSLYLRPPTRPWNCDHMADALKINLSFQWSLI